MIRYLKNRLHAYIQGVIAEKMDSIAAYTASRLDTLDIASKVQLQMDLEPIIEQTVDRVKTGHAVDYERLAECIDVTEVAAHMDTGDIDWDYSQIASEISVDYSDLAGEIDTSNIASEVEVDAEEVAEHLDYKRLAAALLDAVRAGT